MPIAAARTIYEGKKDVQFLIYVSGAAPVTPPDMMAVYTDIPVGHKHRLLEIQTKLRSLINRAREENYRRPSGATCYWRVPLDGSKADIEFTTVAGDIVEGDVAIGLNGDIRNEGRGSVIISIAWKEIGDWLREQGQLTA